MRYPGGKNGDGVFQFIINQMPPHRVYIEAFLGSGAILRRKRPADFNYGIDKDPAATAAVKPILTFPAELITGDFLNFIQNKNPLSWHDVLIYADPPYLRSTRSCQRDLYNCEFATEQEHTALLDLAQSIPAMWMISGYRSDLYERRLTAPAWRLVTYQATTRRGVREECLWMNFAGGEELHDYTFAGRDRTDRQRIKRKVARWQARLLSLPTIERNAIFEAVDRVKRETSARDPVDSSDFNHRQA